MLDSYLTQLAETARRGDAREESFYSALTALLNAFAASTSRDQAHVTVLPRRTEAGNPDFRVWDGRQRITGYLEAKAPGTDLDEAEESEQLRRYRTTFPNLILTDFCEFRLYRDGDLKLAARLVRPYAVTAGSELRVEEGDETLQLLDTFFGFSVPRAYDAESLATELAARTRFLRDVVHEQLKAEIEEGDGTLLAFYEAFQIYLMAGLDPLTFSDLYAQTLTYGLFAARIRAGDDFSRRTAADHIPRSIGLLHEIFEFISYGELPAELEWIADDIAEVLLVADAGAILDRYYREGRGSDPVIHFYETFLAAYDPEEREQRGVYYTPVPVVSYIVRSLHLLLQERFDRAEGLASPGVTLLDPAAGTMTFVATAVREAAQEFTARYGSGGLERFLTDHILPAFHGFELMMAPYAIGHLKMSFILEELGHRLTEKERFQLYLTNSLEMEELEQTRLPGLKSLAEESRLAGEIKKQKPILVILGNPPYSGHSENPSERLVEVKEGQQYVIGWRATPDGRVRPETKRAPKRMFRRQPTFIGALIREYFFVGDKPLNETQVKWLHDDYVKFIRFAQWKVEEHGIGTVGMITNHAYLDNPTFRGMRDSLLRSFDEIRILDLHGSVLKRERTPDGEPDQNVFDIRPGVAIVLLIKTEEPRERARVFRADLWGAREEKYVWLEENDVSSTEWVEIEPRPDFFLFVDRDPVTVDRYDSFTSITSIFPNHSVGMVTARDALTIGWSPEDVWETVRTFSDLPAEAARERFSLGSDARDWRVELAQEDVRNSGPSRDHIAPVLYRPFDLRFTYYTGRSRGFIGQPQRAILGHLMAGPNIALVTTRAVEIVDGFTHVFCARELVQHHTVSVKEVNYVLPLYLYNEMGAGDLFFEVEGRAEPRPNLHPRVLDLLDEQYGERPTPEDLFFYVYATLHAPSYREAYAELLRADFARVPFPSDGEVFAAVSKLGERLVSLHLLESEALDRPTTRFYGRGDNVVASRQSEGFIYAQPHARLHINPDQYFEPISEEQWGFRIGGYQILHKWLKDRRGRPLSADEIRTYCRIATALQRTLEVQEEIDALYSRVEEAVVDLNLE